MLHMFVASYLDLMKTNLSIEKLPPRSSLQRVRLHIFESLLPGRQDSEVTTWRAVLACFLQRIEWPYDCHATGSWSTSPYPPSSDLELNSLITVIWLGKQPPAVTELKHFLQVRKDKVLSALQYLVQNNPVYL